MAGAVGQGLVCWCGLVRFARRHGAGIARLGWHGVAWT